MKQGSSDSSDNRTAVMTRDRFPGMESLSTSRAIEAVVDALGECLALVPGKRGRTVRSLPGVDGRIAMLRSLAAEVRELENSQVHQ